MTSPLTAAPARGLNGTSCTTGGHLVRNLVGAMTRAGYFERG